MLVDLGVGWPNEEGGEVGLVRSRGRGRVRADHRRVRGSGVRELEGDEEDEGGVGHRVVTDRSLSKSDRGHSPEAHAPTRRGEESERGEGRRPSHAQASHTPFRFLVPCRILGF